MDLNSKLKSMGLKRYSIAFGGDEWGMVVDCDTPSQADELCEAFKMYYGEEELDQLEILKDGELIKKLI